MNASPVQTHKSTFLPTELWNAIFRDMGKKDLTTLARVSYLFQEEAEHVLYRHVYFSGTIDGARLASWCMSIISERRRASRVHILRLRSCFKPRGDLADSSAEIQQLLAQVFKVVINLKELHGDAGKMTDDSVPTVVPSTFKDCTFRLTCMSGSFAGMTAGEMLQFLSTQPDISYWAPSPPLIQSISAIPPNTLASIRELVLVRPEKLPLFYGWPIQKLGLEFHKHPRTQYDGHAAIKRFKETLRVLSYMGFLTGWTAPDIIRSLAKDAPNIELLNLYLLTHGKYTVSTDEQKDLVEAISGFKHLHSLALSFRMDALHDPNTDPPDPSNPLEHGPIWTPDSPAQCRKVASMFMESCPSLQRISFPFKNVEGRNYLRYLCYGRPRDSGPGGKAEAWLEGFNIVNCAWWLR